MNEELLSLTEEETRDVENDLRSFLKEKGISSMDLIKELLNMITFFMICLNKYTNKKQFESDLTKEGSETYYKSLEIMIFYKKSIKSILEKRKP